jgi:hypothetical protein
MWGLGPALRKQIFKKKKKKHIILMALGSVIRGHGCFIKNLTKRLDTSISLA